jgi:hypothetical protein
MIKQCRKRDSFYQRFRDVLSYIPYLLVKNVDFIRVIYNALQIFILEKDSFN